jgi:hypothetical protein
MIFSAVVTLVYEYRWMAAHRDFNMQFTEMPVLIKRRCTLDQETKQTSIGRNLNQGQEKLLFADYK